MVFLKRFLLLIVVVAFAAFLLHNSPKEERFLMRLILPVKVSDAATFSLEPYKGRPVMIMSLSTGCRFCELSMPLLSLLEKRYESSDIVFIAMYRDHFASSIRSFQRKYDVNFIAVSNAGKFNRFNLGKYGTPRFIFLDREHRISTIDQGYSKYDNITLDAAIKKII